MEFSQRAGSPMLSLASPVPSSFLKNGGSDSLSGFASSTPACVSRPLPQFMESKNSIFQFRNPRPFRSEALQPQSPTKSAPPVSRVFPHRQWAPEKAHAVSFRDDSSIVDSAIQSRFYDSERSELYFEQCFHIEKKLGEGSFGEVMKVRSLDNRKFYAVKRSRERFRNEADRKRKLDEVKKHEQLSAHTNCVEFVKAWEENHRLYIQTELCLTSVQEYWESKGSIPEDRVWCILTDILSGLSHIHKHGFIHLDIKPANIFLSNDGVCKIGDFGLVVDHRDLADAREGDNKYMAPELLDSVFSTKADVFSLGIAVLELASNIELPRDGAPWRLLRCGYIPPECVQRITPELHCIIKWMLTPDHEARPTVQDVFDHPIIVNRQRKEISRKLANTCASLCYAAVAFVRFIIYNSLALPFSVLLRPLSNSRDNLRHGKGGLNTKRDFKEIHRPVGYKWESTDSGGTSSSESRQSIAASSHQSGVFSTPNVTTRSRSHIIPTPRNSSPVASRTKRHAMNESLDISPLSHSKRQCRHLNSTGKCRSNLNSFFSDAEDSTYYSDSLLASKPRNLLNELDDVSDSE